jgi:hypothetical protein
MFDLYGFVKLELDSFCGNKVIRIQQYWVQLCDLSVQLFTMYGRCIYLIFVDCSSSLMLSAHDSCMQTWPQKLSLLIHLTMCARTLKTNAHQPLVLFHNRARFLFCESLTRPSRTRITYSPTWALQRENKPNMNIQCCQLKDFFQCSKHKRILFFSFLVFPLFCSRRVHKRRWTRKAASG